MGSPGQLVPSQSHSEPCARPLQNGVLFTSYDLASQHHATIPLPRAYASLCAFFCHACFCLHAWPSLIAPPHPRIGRAGGQPPNLCVALSLSVASCACIQHFCRAIVFRTSAHAFPVSAKCVQAEAASPTHIAYSDIVSLVGRLLRCQGLAQEVGVLKTAARFVSVQPMSASDMVSGIVMPEQNMHAESNPTARHSNFLAQVRDMHTESKPMATSLVCSSTRHS